MSTTVAFAAPPIFTGYSINVQNGQMQRSFIRYLDLSFNTGVSLSSLLTDNRIKLTRYTLNGINGVNVPLPATTVATNHIILNFGAQGIGGNSNSNIGDGYYEIAVDMDGNGSFESMKYFYRLLGDISGDRKVTSADKTQVLMAQGGTYNPESDANGDGLINVVDTSLVTRAINRSLNNGLPITQNGLTIVQKATVSTDTAVANQGNITLLRFEAVADNEGILATSFLFNAAQGSLNNAQNYRLWVDTDNNGSVDTVIHSTVSPVSGVVTFNSITGGGYVVPSNQPVIFEVHADVVSSLTSNSLQLQFATTSPTYVGAERLSNGSVLSGIKTNGTCATTCETTVTTAAATVWSFVSQGDLYITQSSTPERNHQLLGGTLGDSILRLQMHAEYEDIDVTNLVFTPTGTDATVFATSVNRLEIYAVGSTTPLAVATTATCGTDPVPANSMCARMLSQELIVAEGSNANFVIRPLMRTDAQGSVSGKNIQIAVDAVQGAKARGLLSSNLLSLNDGDALAEGELFIGISTPAASQTVTGKKNVVVHSKITVIINASTDTNGTSIPVGVSRIGEFKFSAAAASNNLNGPNKFTLTDIFFTVNTTNVATASGSYKMYNKADPTSQSPCAVSVVSASQLIAKCINLTLSLVNTEIDPGTDATFVLQADVTNPKISNASSSTLQVSLQNFDSINNTTFDSAASHIRWLDKDNVSSTPFLWIEYPETVINGTSYNG